MTEKRADPGALRLAKRLDGFPLALVTAGAFLRKTTMTFEQYLDAYQRKWNINPRRQLHLLEYQDRTLYTTWNLSYDRLCKKDPNAAQMLRLMAYFDNQRVWYDLLTAGLTDDSPEWLQATLEDQATFEGTMAVLVDYYFVEVQHISQSYSMHSCVHDWTLGELNATTSPEFYWYAFDCVAKSIENDDRDSFGHVKYSHMSQHARRLTHPRFEACDELSVGITGREEQAIDIGVMLAHQVQLSAAEQMYLRALAGYATVLGPDHISTLGTVENLSVLYALQGKLEQAEQMLLQALARYETVLGPDHISTIHTVGILSVLYARQGKLEQAKQMYLRALVGFKVAVRPDHILTLHIVNSLGVLYAEQGNLEQAEQMLLRALAGFESALGPSHSLTLRTARNLSGVYHAQHRHTEAEVLKVRYSL